VLATDRAVLPAAIHTFIHKQIENKSIKTLRPSSAFILEDTEVSKAKSVFCIYNRP